MPELELYEEYSRADVHNVFSQGTAFTPGAGIWGLHGAVPVPDRPGDYAFFVTFGQKQGSHAFDEGVTREGVLTWQSQPSQTLEDPRILEWILHDDLRNTIYLFLRTGPRRQYAYLGKLKYLNHDRERERPVHFKWQLLDWMLPEPRRVELDLTFTEAVANAPGIIAPIRPLPTQHQDLSEVPAPPRAIRSGVSTPQFRGRQNIDYSAQDARDRALGISGEIAVLAQEKKRLLELNLAELANNVAHVSQTEGDGAGYDIRSFNADGTVRYIEVKATRGGISTPFYMSIKEIQLAALHADQYFLFRIFEFDPAAGSGKVFQILGDIGKHLQLDPINFRVRV